MRTLFDMSAEGLVAPRTRESSQGDFVPVQLRKPVDPSSSVDGDDVLNIKTALGKLGYYQPPKDIGISPFPDDGMFVGIRDLQRDHGLETDRVMNPSGPTEAVLNRVLARAGKPDRMSLSEGEDGGQSATPAASAPTNPDCPEIVEQAMKIEDTVMGEFRSPEQDEIIKKANDVCGYKGNLWIDVDSRFPRGSDVDKVRFRLPWGSK